MMQDNGSSKKNNHVVLIIVLSIVAIFMVVGFMAVPFIILGVISSSWESKSYFESINDTTISIPSANMVVSVTEEYYNQEDKCYVLVTKAERSLENDDDFWGTSDIGVIYDFKDQDGYSLGELELVIDNVNSNDKWKRRVYFCGDEAEEVAGYEISNVMFYE